MQWRLLLADVATARRRVVTVVYPSEADSSAGRLSVLDPLGAALFGASLGDVVDCHEPDGASRLRIEQILYQPEQSLQIHLIVRG